MLHLAQITQWVDNRDSKKRTHARDLWANGYREFLINPSRIVDLVDTSTLAVASSHFRFSDVDRDRREATSFIVCNSSVAQIEASHNTAYFSKFITLPFCPKNKTSKTPVDTTLDVEDIAYFDRYNPDPDNFVWLVYTRKGFRRVEQLVALNLEQVEDIAETGTTSTSTTTEEDRQ